ncbi:hypothetical protein QJS04_geneDACA022256 [Acorus gramineus]|uniref:Uncharacterized protein n=1 Tax=Acorus gramineus TaxID=55184 RepID=A0AAV9BCX6_ACOGR|nr:hypothetical protein QJS04_geneDACA022256 [Acorus gramineus]
MSKLLHLWCPLLHHHRCVLCIVSSEPDLLLSLVEISDSLRRFVSLFSHLDRSRSPDPHHRWILSSKDMNLKSKQMEHFVPPPPPSTRKWRSSARLST